MKGKVWLIGWLIIVCIGLGVIGGYMYKIDPYMHFHKPDTERYFYSLDNQRSQNDGITKHFNYDALITGTSMTENFKTSEMNTIFDCNSIKVSYSGGSYKEMNDNLKIAVNNNPNLKTVVRGLDIGMFFDDKDRMREDLGAYPTYLYDANPLNDVKYLFNRDLIWNRVYSMVTAINEDGFKPGITSFDDYSRWQYYYVFGINTVCPDGVSDVTKGKPVHLTDEQKEIIKNNITQNVTSLAEKNSNITFYYFFTPYSAVWWKDLVSAGTIYKQIEAEKYIIELILECDNIKLFSFNNRMDITTNLNNYKDAPHYGQWVNSLMLRWMHDGKYQLTKENYNDYLNDEMNNYLNFDYYSLNEQDDYESDFYAAALLNEELTGAKPIKISDMSIDEIQLSNANIVKNQHDGQNGIECKGSLARESGSDMSLIDYLVNNQYIGATIELREIDDYGYLVFYGKKVKDHGQPTVYILNEKGEKVGEIVDNYNDIDNEWHQYVIDITAIKGDIKIVFNGGYIDNTGNVDSDYIFSDITLY